MLPENFFDEIIHVDVGDHVYCDACGKDFTDSKECGGWTFGSKTYGPCCATEEKLNQIKGYGEERFIKHHCPADMPFADWVRNVLRVYY